MILSRSVSLLEIIMYLLSKNGLSLVLVVFSHKVEFGYSFSR